MLGVSGAQDRSSTGASQDRELPSMIVQASGMGRPFPSPPRIILRGLRVEAAQETRQQEVHLQPNLAERMNDTEP